MRTKTPTAIAAALLGLSLAVAGCSSSSAPESSTTESTKTVTVFAAASMKTTFTELGKTFEASHAGTKVTFNFAGSQTLAEQITQGAQVDAFASANEANMKTVTDAGLNAAEPKIYATNVLEIAVPPDNPAGVASFADLAKKDVKVVVCAPAVPCGAATEKVEKATGITLSPVSEEQAVTDVLAKVQAGEADAGLVYKTDVLSAGDTVKGVPFPESKEAINKNSIVGLKGPQAALGQEFVDLVLSSDGQKVLATAGFGPAE
ncbi:putative molybdate ABC transporter molybdate-binding protein [Microlunatus phosphovorus NM-1]|uniref:Putative molybdate ABC transporter molybdate-binding protein n=1 Tax=Microlunatus phosphovorus (strain ATCC 700054 / DSM 10555 / JCM 9379 / NBRC 101784 / NCIMB 13414 / VKM Ac-1990 / NM-1) TaxID=1032480 RepID=F5XFN3_MICPN|nr:molybdate ABC transporter substrate-binding protein [Microlunatus phosphovorus]BAK35440.1 putative molybdate ABC transporter molybdate-binding protein [Microlunatus phosphovorus NM-1]